MLVLVESQILRLGLKALYMNGIQIHETQNLYKA